MARHRPWYKRYPADFIHGVRGLSLEAVGAYSLLIDIFNDRDAGLTDDDRFIAGLLGCPTQRWKKLRAELIRAGKLTRDDKGCLTNPRFERERAERHLLSAEAAEHGRQGGLISAERRAQQEMDLQPPPPVRARVRSGAKNEKKSQLNPKVIPIKFGPALDQSDLTPRKTAKKAEGTLQPCARATQRLRDSEEDNTQPTPLTTREGRLANADLKDLLDACCEAAGFQPMDPTAIDRALRQVEAWRKEGLDFDEVVLPAIRSTVAGSSPLDRTRTLGRFRFAIAREHALFLARGKHYRPPEPPLLERPGEPAKMATIRQVLCQVLGPQTFAVNFNPLTLGERDETTLSLSPHWWGQVVIEGTHGPTIRAVARRHGYNAIWT